MKFFKEKEFACKCCGQVKLDEEFGALLDEARKLAGVPFKLTSGYRCPEHNKAVGSKPTSSHTKGLAVDISATDSRTRFLILDALLAVGFTRIGIADTFIHVDLDTDKSQEVIWTY